MITENSVASEPIVINAPAELVWQVLIDFDNYPQWNTFCPQAHAKLEIGSPIEMKVDLGNGLQDQTEYLTRIEPNRVIAWGMANKPDDPIHAVRTQSIEPITHNSCTYNSIDEFSGSAMAPMIAAMGKAVESGFNRCALDLKQHAEQLHQQTAPQDISN